MRGFVGASLSVRASLVGLCATLGACGGATLNSGAVELDAEQKLMLRYPESNFIASVQCSDKGLQAAREAARVAVSTQVSARIKAELTTEEHSRTDRNGGSASWSDLIQKVGMSTDFDDAQMIQSGPQDAMAGDAIACACAHLSRAEADKRLVERWRDAMGRLTSSTRRCEEAFARKACEAFAPANRDAQVSLVELFRVFSDRLAVSRVRTAEMAQVEQTRDRLFEMAGQLRSHVSFAIGAGAVSAENSGHATEAIVGAFQKLGVQAAAGTYCSGTTNYQVRIDAEETCESSYVGQVCRVRMTLTGGRCGETTKPFQVVLAATEPSVHPRSRAAAVADAWRQVLDEKVLSPGIREGLSRIVPL